MSAVAEVRGLFGNPATEAAFRAESVGEASLAPYGGAARADNFKTILRRSGYTITQLSVATRRRYGSRSPYFIPATFIYKLKSGITPHVCQIAAVSHITGYRFIDWLRVCGFDLLQIPLLQMRLHSERTVLVTLPEYSLEFFLRDSCARPHEAVWNSSAGARSEEWSPSPRYLFAKIGAVDAMVHPALPPGSIVRVDRSYAHPSRGPRVRGSNLLWLVEQSSGLTCTQLKWIDDRQVVLLPSRPPSGCWPLCVPAEARILGLVDIGYRPLESMRAQPGTGPRDPDPPLPQPHREEPMKYSDLLRNSRRRAGLTFRAAHRLTCNIAQILANQEYAVALGLLSDYEAMNRLPRHIAKILSLCAVYCMDFRELMEAARVHIDDSAKLPLAMLDGRLPLGTDLRNAPPRDAVVRAYAQSAGT